MILLVQNRASQKWFLLTNTDNILKVVSYDIAHGILYGFPNSILRLEVGSIEEINELRKKFKPLVKDKPELNLGECIKAEFPEIFI